MTEQIRFRYERCNEISYIAHLDMMRMFERALSRAKIACDYTKGFNPRPIMSFALPSGVGVATIDDYFDISVKEKTNPLDAVNRLNKVLPDGVKILAATKIENEKQSLMAQVCASKYMFNFPLIGRFKEILESETVMNVEKTSKNKTRTINVKDFILNVEVKNQETLVVTVKAGSSQNLRPDLLLEAFIGYDNFTKENALDTKITRIATFISNSSGEFISPIN